MRSREGKELGGSTAGQVGGHMVQTRQRVKHEEGVLLATDLKEREISICTHREREAPNGRLRER
jgi:hypothetical protein